MSVAFWIVAALLALAFVAGGLIKLFRPKEALAASGMAWTEDFSAGTIKLIAALEVIGAVGVIVPALVGVAAFLSPVAAIGLALVMIGAIVVHVRRKEPATSAVVLLVLSIAAAALGFAYVG